MNQRPLSCPCPRMIPARYPSPWKRSWQSYHGDRTAGRDRHGPLARRVGVLVEVTPPPESEEGGK
jgi:hypothetical protein